MENTLGHILKKYREKKGFTIEEFSKLTKIPKNTIIELENDNFDVLPEDFYIQKYIKTYANYLKMNEKKLLEKYFEQRGDIPDSSKIKKSKGNENKVYVTPSYLKIGVMMLVAFVVIGYLILQVLQIYEEPYLEVTTPSEDIVITENFIEIRGRTEEEAFVYINDKEVLTDSRGYFQATLDLKDGYNVIEISAKKKHSKEHVIFREILVQ